MTLNDPSPDFLNHLDAALPGVVSPISDVYLQEPRGNFSGNAAALLRPRSTQEVVEIVKRAVSARIGLVPYSGGTGLVGGQVPHSVSRCLVVSMERMNTIRQMDAVDRSMIVEAGVILADVQAVALAENLLFPLSLASEGSCRIGGNLGTNAGGVNVIRYGNTRDLCLGIEAVFPDGSVFNGLKSLKKDNTGYDLRHLLIGSEGTLGIITAAQLKLSERPVERVTALLDIASPMAALTLLRELQTRFGETISAFELIDRTGIEFLKTAVPDLKLPPTGTGKWLALVEIGAGAGAGIAERFEQTLETLMGQELIADGHIAQSDSQRNTIWQMRETIPEANRLIGAIGSHDISVPASSIPSFIDAGRLVVQKIDTDLRINCFGHLGDGNLHYNVYPPHGRKKTDYADIRSEISTAIYDLVDQFDGSISAEHGIGRLKKQTLLRYGDPAKLAAMRAIKSALDPHGIMNPGAVIDV